MGPLQGTLLGAEEPAVDRATRPERIALDETSWVEVTRNWLRGADTLLDALVPTITWHQGRRRMYDRILDEPRLSRSFSPGDALPHPALAAIQAALIERCAVPLGGMFLNYYRDGRDSVAWHGDRELRYLDDTLVAIVTLGAVRPFLLRPRRVDGVGGGRAHDLRPGSGDLIVMGGRCQRDWEHAVPKVVSAGPRISVSVRWSSRAGQPTRRVSSRYPNLAASSPAALGGRWSRR
ncbi:MAG: alpha-ketoglutarate-dependent dioxygenase AlkB [Acidimicrobiia bacterium]|nr:alpha-ketoglutarate-dependent dioxygenase AlkB [Acidimicrobiia bacterium]